MPTHRRLLQIISSIVIVTILVSGFSLPSALAQGKGDGLKRQVNAQTGKVSFVGPESGVSLSASQTLGTFIRPQNPAMALAQRFAPEFGLKNPARDLSEIKSNHAENGRLTARYQQKYNDVPVMGGELIVSTDDNGAFYSMNGEVSPDLSLSTQPMIDSAQARQTALQAVAKWYQKKAEVFVTSEPELWIFDESLLRSSTRPPELVWRMDVTPKDTGMPVQELVLINAQKGSISLHFNQIDTVWTAGGKSTNNVSENLTRAGSSTSTNAINPAGNAAVSDLSGNFVLGAPIVKTYTTNHGSVLPGAFLCDQTKPNCTNGINPHADAAHKYAIGTYNFYATQFNRDSINNAGLAMISSVHYCDSDPSLPCPYDNAFWDGKQMVYGDAYGFPLADDVVAHELTHGVTQYESNLFYYYQAGAINESLSDVFGEYYDQTNGLGNDTTGVKWLLGEDTSGLGALRNMSDPTTFGDPDRMSSPFYELSGDDSGGVHHNSGINNKAASLMVDGGTFNLKTVTALGWTKTGAIYYEANSKLLTSGADYSDLYFALQQACKNLTGQKGITSADCTQVKNALDAVEMSAQPSPNFNTDAPMCPSGYVASAASFVDDLEAGTGKWTFNNGAYPRWQLDSSYFGPYAQSGLHSLYADDFPAKVTDATAKLTPLAIPSNAYLTFAQAYDFEASDAFYDGGVLEYSVNNGSTWADAGPLMNFNGYDGTISTAGDNPLKGRSAFVGASHGYISTRLNLASLAGKTAIFRWRMGLDTGTYAMGWWVDNVRLYRCNPLPPAAFNKTSPINGATGVGLSTTLSWSASSFATSYQYCYDLVNDNQCNRTWTGPVNGTSVNLSHLGANTTYYWQVRAVNAVGTTYANNATWNSFTTTSTLPAGTAGIEAWVGTSVQGKYSLGHGESLRDSYPSLNNGPVKLFSTNNIPLIGAERVIYKVNKINTSFTEMMGLPNSQLDGTYWLPWYNNKDLDTQLRIGNVSSNQATVRIWIGSDEMTTGCVPSPSMSYPYVLSGGQSLRVSCPVNDGPVKIVSTVNIVAAERIIYKTAGGTNTSFSEMMALPNSQLDSSYWLPWYNNVDLDTQLRFGNVDPLNQATVHVKVGGAEVTGCLPHDSPFTLQVGESVRLSCTGLNNGPVEIFSDNNVPIVASERLIYKVNGVNTSFTEMMALPKKQLDSTYWLPWYNNADLDTQLRFGNVSNQTATVHVYIGAQEMTSGCSPSGSPYTLPLGASLRISCAGTNNGPVRIVSDVPIVAAERLIYKVNGVNTSFSEMMALPDSQLDSSYWLPWYNNADLDTQLRFGVP